MKTVKSALNLVDARKEALKEEAKGTLRPHGKLWGKDAFSWNNPTTELFAMTMHAFPFPILWVTPAGFANEVVKMDPSVMSNVNSIVSYGDGETLNEQLFVDAKNIQCVIDPIEGLLSVRDSALKHAVILFVTIGENGVVTKEQFSAFLNVHQI